jgi:hypothetical protein
MKIPEKHLIWSMEEGRQKAVVFNRIQEAWNKFIDHYGIFLVE